MHDTLGSLFHSHPGLTNAQQYSHAISDKFGDSIRHTFFRHTYSLHTYSLQEMYPNAITFID